jgi:hypothetical protein
MQGPPAIAVQLDAVSPVAATTSDAAPNQSLPLTLSDVVDDEIDDVQVLQGPPAAAAQKMDAVSPAAATGVTAPNQILPFTLSDVVDDDDAGSVVEISVAPPNATTPTPNGAAGARTEDEDEQDEDEQEPLHHHCFGMLRLTAETKFLFNCIAVFGSYLASGVIFYGAVTKGVGGASEQGHWTFSETFYFTVVTVTTTG